MGVRRVPFVLSGLFRALGACGSRSASPTLCETPTEEAIFQARMRLVSGTKGRGVVGEMPDCQLASVDATLARMSTKLVERGARIRRTKWVELSCMLCGEAVATLEGGTLLRPRTEASV